jgi:serine phosphatase RsbU (regulator of sigma subunit)
MQLSIAVAKIDKWAVRQGGDTLEMIERPNGGVSVVLADGQSSGPGAKAISIWVVRKVVAELAEGVRDGAAARAANDALFSLRSGKVSCTLTILSVDLSSRTLVFTRCGDLPVYVRTAAGELHCLESKAPTLGFYRHARPAVDQVPLAPGVWACAFTDGLRHAGTRKNVHLDLPATLEELWAGERTAQQVADELLARSMALDDQRPVDDTSLMVLHACEGADVGPRRMQVEMPVPEV